MRNPVEERRSRLGFTKQHLAGVLHTNARFVTLMEQGKRRVSDKFYIPLRKIGIDPFQLAIEQDRFIEWRRKFHSYLIWGITPPSIG